MRPCTARGWSHWPDTAAKQLTCVHGASVRSGFEVWLQQLFLSAARKVSQVGVGDIQRARSRMARPWRASASVTVHGGTTWMRLKFANGSSPASLQAASVAFIAALL